MSLAIVIGYDATHANIARLPKTGIGVGYTTGGSGIEWTEADWLAHPGAVRICQDAGATDATADTLDVERGAATLADCPGWSIRASASYRAGTRAGQRKPSIYTSASNVTPVVNSLVAGGIKDGVGLFVADWNLSNAQAVLDLQSSAGPFPIDGFQFANAGLYDIDVFLASWLEATASDPPAYYRHVVPDGNKLSMGEVAHSHKEPVEAVAQCSATFLDKAELAALVRYLGDGDWALLHRAGASRPMPAGLVYCTYTP